MKRKHRIALALILSLVFTASIANFAAADEKQSKKGFVSIFDGKSLDGWRKLTEYSGDKGDWQVIGGSITGDQYPAGEGGLLVTEKKYSDYEITMEVKADYPVDSGLFLRVQPDVSSYQVTIDYRPEGELGAIYSPTNGGFLTHCKEGESYWKKGEYNKVRAIIVGQPAKIKAWINGKLVADYTDTMVDGKYRVPGDGYIGIQVHPGDSWGKGNKVYFKKIMVKELKK